MLRIGLTGGIAAGKSVVARRFEELGAVLVDADVLARRAVEPGSEGLHEVVAAFGPGILASDGSLDRPALGRLIFGDAAARERLNGIIHPRVRESAAELISQAAPDAIVVEDIPLLVETRQAARFHLVVVVDAPDGLRVQRMVEQRGMGHADAEQRIAAQASRAERLGEADAILVNDRSLEELHAATDALWHARLAPFAANLATGTPGQERGRPPSGPGMAVTGTSGLARRVRARVLGALPHGLSASVDPESGEDGHDDVTSAALRITVAHAPDVGAASEAVGAAGFPRAQLRTGGPEAPVTHLSADPATAVTLSLRPGSAAG